MRDELGRWLPVSDSAWRRLVVLAACLFAAWAAWVAMHVYTVDDPAGRAALRYMASHLGEILTHVPRNAVLVLALLFTLGASIAPGDALLRALRIPARDAFDRIAFGAAAGLAVLITIAYAMAALQLLHRRFEVSLLIVGFAASAYSIWRWLRASPGAPDEIRVPRALSVVMWVLLGAALFVALLAALIPEAGFDARYYQLAQAHRYAQHHGFFNLVATERIWAFALPHYQETLYAFEWTMFGAVGAKMIAWGDAIVTVLALIAFSRAWFSSTAIGLMASLLLFTSPVVAWSATTAKNDLAAVPLVILALHCFLTWQATGATRALAGAGLFAGLTYGIKTFGAFTVVALGLVAACVLIGRRVSLPRIALQLAPYAGCALLAALPALVTAQIMIGDPLFPLAPRLFASRFGAAAMATNVSNAVGSQLLETLKPVTFLSLPWTVTTDPLKFRDLPGPLWLVLLPLWLAVPFFARRHVEVIRALAGFAAFFTAMVLISGAIEFRYLETVLPVVALLIAYGMLGFDWRSARVLQASLIASVLVFGALGNGLTTWLSRSATNPAVMGAQFLNFEYLYEDFPERNLALQFVPILDYANAHLDPQRDKIYDAVDLQLMNVFSEPELFNGTSYGSPAALHEWSLASPDAYERLRAAGCTYVVVAKPALRGLQVVPVWKHLKLVAERPESGRIDVLLKVVD